MHDLAFPRPPCLPFWPYNRCLRLASLDLDAGQVAGLELVDHPFHGYPLDAFVLVDPLDDALVHEHHLRFPADLRVNAHGKDKSVVLPVQEGKLVLPKSFDDVRVDEPVGGGLLQRELERRPVVQVPVGGDFDHLRRFERAHGLHPFGRVQGRVGLGPFLVAGRAVVQLRVVVHERVVVLDAKLFEQLDSLPRRRPRRSRPASRFLADELGHHLDRLGQDVTLLLLAQGRHKFVRVAV